MRVSVRRLALYPLFAAQRSGALQSPFLHQISPRSRTLFSETGVWEKDYRTETRRKVEGWWHPRIMAQWRTDAMEEVRGSFKVSNNKLKIKWMIVLLLVTSSYKKNPKLSLYMTQQVLQLPLTAQRYACWSNWWFLNWPWDRLAVCLLLSVNWDRLLSHHNPG